MCQRVSGRSGSPWAGSSSFCIPRNLEFWRTCVNSASDRVSSRSRSESPYASICSTLLRGNRTKCEQLAFLSSALIFTDPLRRNDLKDFRQFDCESSNLSASLISLAERCHVFVRGCANSCKKPFCAAAAGQIRPPVLSFKLLLCRWRDALTSFCLLNFVAGIALTHASDMRLTST